jgi:4a-hydroxytetrahydrobiopterin dehydratase
MNDLLKKNCVACQGGIPALKEGEIKIYLSEIKDWHVIDNHHIEKTFEFPDFASALSFVNKVGALAEQEGHHPNISFTWGKVEISIWTHKINGLHENDFILAAKVDTLS